MPGIRMRCVLWRWAVPCAALLGVALSPLHAETVRPSPAPSHPASLPIARPNVVTPIFTQIAYPYTGDYGNGGTDYKGWENELMLQVQKIVAYVDAKTPTGRAIILGDFNSGPELLDFAVEKEGAPEYTFLSNKFPEALPADYKPHCTYCGKGENYLAAGGLNSWIDHIFLKNIAVSEVKSAQRRFTEATVAVTPSPDSGDADGGPSAIPLSDHFGMSAVINIQP